MDLWRATSRWVGGASWAGRYKSLLAVALNRLRYIHTHISTYIHT